MGVQVGVVGCGCSVKGWASGFWCWQPRSNCRSGNRRRGCNRCHPYVVVGLVEGMWPRGCAGRTRTSRALCWDSVDVMFAKRMEMDIVMIVVIDVVELGAGSDDVTVGSGLVFDLAFGKRLTMTSIGVGLHQLGLCVGSGERSSPRCRLASRNPTGNGSGY